MPSQRDRVADASIGLYDPRFEHDACGIGFVANAHGVRSHELLQLGLEALTNLGHRGAVSADGLSGDGAGLMSQLPHRCLREWAALPAHTDMTSVGLGMVFVGEDGRDVVEHRFREELARIGASVLRWRDVPIDRSQLGEQATSTLPAIRQVIFQTRGPERGEALERLLYLVRRRIQRSCHQQGLEPLHICSLSTRTVVYKGLVIPSRLRSFYLDLQDPTFETAIVTFHQRFSTNTLPSWSLAQPFRLLAHNGEINTVRGNTLRMQLVEKQLDASVFGEHIADLFPIVNPNDSDSLTLDRVFELLVRAGRDPLHALSIMVPEPYQWMPDMDDDVRAMFEHNATVMAPWEGPAALVFSDGEIAGACLDRNGLRPLRYWVSRDGLVVAGSETGIASIEPGSVVEKGRLGPGWVFGVDTRIGRVMRNDEIKLSLAKRLPYRAWFDKTVRLCGIGVTQRPRSDDLDDDRLLRLQRAFGYGKEVIDRVLKPMSEDGKPPVGSMGDDIPLAVLSSNPQPVYRYLKQHFAQVTNPPIDSLRERLVMSLDTLIGGQANPLQDLAPMRRLIRFPSPVIGADSFGAMMSPESDLPTTSISTRFPVADGAPGFERRVREIADEAAGAVANGSITIVLSDRSVDAEHAGVPMVLALSAVHQRLVNEGVRAQASIVCEAGDAYEDHHVACLVGCGASIVHPYLAIEAVRAISEDPMHAASNYISALEQGLLKIMAKMGVCSLDSYRGARLFEAIGLDGEVMQRFFPGMPCRLNGIGLDEIAQDVLRLHAEAFAPEAKLSELGIYRYRRDGEHHAFNPGVFKLLHKAVRTGDADAYDEYARVAESQPLCNLRDLLTWKPLAESIPVEEVEPAEQIAQRFSTQAMSHGALSREAHELLSVAMNRLGAKCNSGEGGEDPIRFRIYEGGADGSVQHQHFHSAWQPEPGDSGNSWIKQVATGRFGVTPHYLVNAREIEIKMCQGAKPGEGGQIPGFKVNEEIAGLRRAAVGTTLISPPPHHDIYSIEDLEQLIFDLKRVNENAEIVVKLVSLAGVGTIAAGVAKAYADKIQISGHDGGTGASPLSSIKHAGLPWELGLAEVQQVLVRNNLRGRIGLRVDGGLRTGRDVFVAALLGAEEFGFGTAALIASGCVMARQCHSNTCPVGVATQRPDLRKKFPGKPEHVVRFMLYVAEQVRVLLAQVGARSLDDVIGRAELLDARDDVTPPRAGSIDLSPMLHVAHGELKRSGSRNTRPEHEPLLDDRITAEVQAALDNGRVFDSTYEINNRQRSVGARVAGRIACKHGEQGLPDGSVSLRFNGCAGQSFGAFCTHGMNLYISGEAQDYVGKGMQGGRLVITPPPDFTGATNASTIIGNTVLYGATGGALFASGRAGERLCVRNSGAIAVVEGAGDHACEYMTGGEVVILGRVGRNLGAGMSGGRIYVLDIPSYVPRHYNGEMVDIRRITEDTDTKRLFDLITRHVELTGSEWGREVLLRWEEMLRSFWVIAPKQPSSVGAIAATLAADDGAEVA